MIGPIRALAGFALVAGLTIGGQAGHAQPGPAGERPAAREATMSFTIPEPASFSMCQQCCLSVCTEPSDASRWNGASFKSSIDRTGQQ